MRDVQEMVQKLSIENSNKIRRICAPLESCFGINYFFFDITTTDGRLMSFGSNPRMHEDYFCSKEFVVNPFHRDPKTIPLGPYVYQGFSEKSFQESVERVKAKLGIISLGGMVIKNNSDILRFGYVTNACNDLRKHLDVFYKNIQMFIKFNEYFISEMKAIIDDANQYAISLPKHVVDYNIEVDSARALPLEKKIRFMKDIGLLAEVDSITSREEEYLCLIARGQTCACIAKWMGLSIRTIEHTVESLRRKFNCKSKTELIDIGKLFLNGQ